MPTAGAWRDLPPELATTIWSFLVDSPRLPRGPRALAIAVEEDAHTRTLLRSIQLVSRDWALKARTRLHARVVLGSVRDAQHLREHLEDEEAGRLPLPFASLVRALRVAPTWFPFFTATKRPLAADPVGLTWDEVRTHWLETRHALTLRAGPCADPPAALHGCTRASRG
jgi:hypothetical protein